MGRSLAGSERRSCSHAGRKHARLPADLRDPLSPLVSAKGSMLCFRRDYSPETSGAASEADDQIRPSRLPGAGLRHPRGHRAHGHREADRGQLRLAAGRGDRYLRSQDDPGFRQASGVRLHGDRGRFRPGGRLPSGRPGAGREIPDRVPAKSDLRYDGKPGKAKGSFVELGPEDRTFALTRIEPKACASFKAGTE